MKDWFKNLPNMLTIIRIILVAPFVYFLIYDFTVFAAITFLIAALTDFIDGYLARKYKLISDFGKFWDPMADKLLVFSALIIFVVYQYIPLWMLLVMALREVVVVGIRLRASAKRRVVAAFMSGKFKTILQIIAVTIIIFTKTSVISTWIMLIPVIVSVLSGIDFIIKTRNYFKKG